MRKKGKIKKPSIFFPPLSVQVNPSSSHSNASAHPHSRGTSKQAAGTTPPCCHQQLRTCAGSKREQKASPALPGAKRLKPEPQAGTAHKEPCTTAALGSTISARGANSAAHNQPSTCSIPGCPWWKDRQTLPCPGPVPGIPHGRGEHCAEC